MVLHRQRGDVFLGFAIGSPPTAPHRTTPLSLMLARADIHCRTERFEAFEPKRRTSEQAVAGSNGNNKINNILNQSARTETFLRKHASAIRRIRERALLQITTGTQCDRATRRQAASTEIKTSFSNCCYRCPPACARLRFLLLLCSLEE